MENLNLVEILKDCPKGTKHLVGTTEEPPIHYKSLCNDN